MERAILIIPAYNEAATLRSVLARVVDADPGCEMVVVDDGSHDGTAEIAARAIDEVRLSRVARYKKPFKPKTKYARDKDTVLLFHFDTDTEPFFPDDSGEGNHGWPAGKPKLEAETVR